MHYWVYQVFLEYYVTWLFVHTLFVCMRLTEKTESQKSLIFFLTNVIEVRLGIFGHSCGPRSAWNFTVLHVSHFLYWHLGRKKKTIKEEKKAIIDFTLTSYNTEWKYFQSLRLHIKEKIEAISIVLLIFFLYYPTSTVFCVVCKRIFKFSSKNKGMDISWKIIEG